MENIIKELSTHLQMDKKYIEKVLEMLKEGDTIPFIARYRKEQTGGMSEDKIREIEQSYTYQVNLFKKKEDVIRLIEEKGLMTEELKQKIIEAQKLVEVEDLYRPYKEKKKTKATEAIALGLEPLAKMILSFPMEGSISTLASRFIKDDLTEEKVIEGACYIISEYISDNAYYRKNLRRLIYQTGDIVTKEKKEHSDIKKVYEMYYEYKEEVKKIKPHRILAINRAEDEKVITVNIEVEKEKMISFLNSKVIKNDKSFVCNIVKDAIKDSFKRLIFPSLEREVRSELTEKAEESAILNFSKNLENLLLTPPMKEKVVLAFDPGYINGCKLAVIDKTGCYLTSFVVTPFSDRIKEEELLKIKEKIKDTILKYKVDMIAIGNGTASRESETLVASIMKEYQLSCKYVIVSEAGASIYSTEKVAQEEFPNLSPNERSAVSIGRRLQDPLSELVKIPPEGIGVGLYQHDIKEKNLKESLDFVVLKVVNSVGVNLNTASSSLLKYVSGLNKTHIDKILEYRKKNGKINSREEAKKIITGKSYEQSIGFLRIIDGENILDATSIHPESYDATIKLLKELKVDKESIGTDKVKEVLEHQNKEELSNKLNIDTYTLEDIFASLIKPNRDPRDEMPQPILKSDVLNIKDLNMGMKLQGTVRNVVDFGCFVDIGLHQDALIHISHMSNEYIKHPSEIVSVGDIIDCYVCDINLEKEKVSLSLLEHF